MVDARARFRQGPTLFIATGTPYDGWRMNGRWDTVQISILVASPLPAADVEPLGALRHPPASDPSPRLRLHDQHRGRGLVLGLPVPLVRGLPVYLVRRGKLFRQRRRRSEAVARFDELIGQAVRNLPGRTAWRVLIPGTWWRSASANGCAGWSRSTLHRRSFPDSFTGQSTVPAARSRESCSWRSSDPTLGCKARPGLPHSTTRKIHWSDPNWKDALAKTADGGIAPGHGLGRAGQVFGGLSVPYTAPERQFHRSRAIGTGCKAMCQIEPRAPETSAEASETDQRQRRNHCICPSRPAGTTAQVLHRSNWPTAGVLTSNCSKPGLRECDVRLLGGVGPVARQGHPALGRAMADRSRPDGCYPRSSNIPGGSLPSKRELHDFTVPCRRHAPGHRDAAFGRGLRGRVRGDGCPGVCQRNQHRGPAGLGRQLRAIRGCGSRVLASLHFDVPPRRVLALALQHVVPAGRRPDGRAVLRQPRIRGHLRDFRHRGCSGQHGISPAAGQRGGLGSHLRNLRRTSSVFWRSSIRPFPPPCSSRFARCRQLRRFQHRVRPDESADRQRGAPGRPWPPGFSAACFCIAACRSSPARGESPAACWQPPGCR